MWVNPLLFSSCKLSQSVFLLVLGTTEIGTSTLAEKAKHIDTGRSRSRLVLVAAKVDMHPVEGNIASTGGVTMDQPIITLTTDFGVDSPYIAVMKGVIFSIFPQVRIVDATHSVLPQDVRQGAMVLSQISPWFPPGTIHVAVVDPGVGSDRHILYAEIGDQRFIVPDNGLLTGVLRQAKAPPFELRALTNSDFWLSEVSATFHGRDIMAPVAARLSQGIDPQRVGPTVDRIVELDWPEVSVTADRIDGEVVSVDSFGNLVTNISTDMLSIAMGDRRELLQVHCYTHTIRGIHRVYADATPSKLVALFGSGGQLEIALVDGNAAKYLGVGVGEPVTISRGVVAIKGREKQ